MKKVFVFTLALIFGLSLLTGVGPFEQKAYAKTIFVTIGTGGITGYERFPSGQSRALCPGRSVGR